MCARKPWDGSVPHTGALLQCITGGGAGSTLVTLGRWGIARKRRAGSGKAARGGLAEATASRAAAESEVELALGLGVGRRRIEPFVVVGESLGVERREADCWRGGRDDELNARSVGVDAVSELADVLG